MGRALADGNYDIILIENEVSLLEHGPLNQFVDSINYKGEIASTRVLITLHTVYHDIGRAPVLRDIGRKIAHFVELFDYECIYLINYAGVPREKCISINDGADGGDNFYDKSKVK
jgi:hypothetical protein